MAKRPENKPLLPKKVLSAEGIKKGIERIDERIAELRAFNVQTVPEGTSHELTALSAAIRDTLDRCFDEGTSTFQRFEPATHLNFIAMIYTSSYPARQDYIEGAHNNITAAIALLQEAQRTLREDLADAAVTVPPQIADELSAPPPNKVFIVHGHDDAAKLAVARFIEKLGLEAIILHEQPNQGRTIIEKFQDYAAQVGFAVVLLTPDDLGGAKAASAQNTRARQNVLFELGYFAAKLGRGKTCLMRKEGVEIPSDLYGVIYTDLDPGEAWKMQLLKEMKAAGLSFDSNKAWA